MASQLLHTVRPSGSSPAGDFTTLAAALSHLESSHSNLTTPTEYYADIEIDDNGVHWSEGAETTKAVVQNVTTSPTCYINIYTTTAARHSGVWNWAKYAIKMYDDHAIQIIGNSIAYLRIDGIQATLDGSSSPSNDTMIGTNDSTNPCDIRVSNCIASGIDDDFRSNCNGFYFNMSGTPVGIVRIWNCIANNFYGDASCNGFGVTIGDSANLVEIYNCTAFHCYRGFATNSAYVKAINCLANGCYDGFVGTFDANSNYNASDIASDAPGANSRNGTNGNAVFVNEATYYFDLHLDSTDVNAHDQGTDNPSGGYYSTDIDGIARASPWDIGADEYISGGGTPVTVSVYESCVNTEG